MNGFLTAFVALVTLAWAWGPILAVDAVPAAGWSAWSFREHALTLTGLLSFALMSLAMVLATRPVWLERPFGGMDRIYRTHKWAGILSVGLAALHWLVEMSDEAIKALWGREGRLTREHGGSVLEAMRDVAEEAGEFAIYALLAMLALTLWKRFPFTPWRYLHKAMPALYLGLAFHAAFLAPIGYWTQPVGLVLGLLITAGAAASAVALLGRIGIRRRVGGVVESVREPAPGLTEVVCALDKRWRGHCPGQFAFVTFDRLEGSHPFTIASADRGDRRISFEIKALGDYTQRLAQRLQPGQAVQVEGPYGCFHLPPAGRKRAQAWIAGGIGITPFLAWLDALQSAPEEAPVADLYYCVRDRDADPFVDRIERLCARLPSLRLHVISSAHREVLNATALGERMRKRADGAVTDIWFCGPQGLADSLRRGLRECGKARFRFHQEAFEMR